MRYKSLLSIFIGVSFVLVMFFCNCNINSDNETYSPEPQANTIAQSWKKLAGARQGKIIYAVPPHMMILDLTDGTRRVVPGIVTAGAPGRRTRGKSPRPFWAADGKHFVYRYDGHIYVSDENGNKRTIINKHMDCSDETRWSWYSDETGDWLAGPSTHGNVILVNLIDPENLRTAYSGGNVEKHCEITGNHKYVVYDDGGDIYVTPFGSSNQGIKISQGQSCRPCAAPDDRVAWLQVPHTVYHIHSAEDGTKLAELKAPAGEELYRLNWSNLSDFAVHMFGSGGNTRIQVRKVSTGEHIFTGYGWDPDLWMDCS